MNVKMIIPGLTPIRKLLVSGVETRWLTFRPLAISIRKPVGR